MASSATIDTPSSTATRSWAQRAWFDHVVAGRHEQLLITRPAASRPDCDILATMRIFGVLLWLSAVASCGGGARPDLTSLVTQTGCEDL
jgi:hypothetical protein